MVIDIGRLQVVYNQHKRSTYFDIVPVGEVRYNTFPRYNSYIKFERKVADD